jgi:GrpB-like predicted nucleotidyltransferase (UPF0157 family)
MRATDEKAGPSIVYARQRERLIAALGEVTEGGLVEAIAHIGATSVIGLAGEPCVDIGLAVLPYPLDGRHLAALARLGYEPAPGPRDGPEHRFVHADGTFQLFVVEAGSERWTDYLLLRDYLNDYPAARRLVSAGKEAWAGSAHVRAPAHDAAREQLFSETIDAARRWYVQHHGFGPVEAVAREMEALAVPWHISSGWALDLHLGHVGRVHHDVDVLVPREDQLEVREYMTARGWKWVTYSDGKPGPWPAQMRMELPRHQAHAHRDGAFIDFVISDAQSGVWRFRRNPSIVRTADRAYRRTKTGLPYLAPEVVLLFKSRTSGTLRAKDQLDFARAHGHLEPEPRAWLRWALTVIDAKHPWIELLR